MRRIAAEIGLPNAKKKDSTGICFIGERPFREFLNRYLANTPGPMKDDRGRTIGEHVGLSFYTLGPAQGHRHRRPEGARRGARRRASTRPGSSRARTWPRNTLYIVRATTIRGCCRDALVADDASWIAGTPPAPGRYAAKTRYRQADAACRCAVAGADGALRARASTRRSGR